MHPNGNPDYIRRCRISGFIETSLSLWNQFRARGGGVYYYPIVFGPCGLDRSPLLELPWVGAGRYRDHRRIKTVAGRYQHQTSKAVSIKEAEAIHRERFAHEITGGAFVLSHTSLIEPDEHCMDGLCDRINTSMPLYVIPDHRGIKSRPADYAVAPSCVMVRESR